jgi:hypothetical protein
VGLKINVREESCFLVIEFGENECVRIPRDNTVQIKTFMLSLVNAGLISEKAAGDVLQLSGAYVRDLAKQLAQKDVGGALLDKRRGQIQIIPDDPGNDGTVDTTICSPRSLWKIHFQHCSRR